MRTIKDLERELTLDWQTLQLMEPTLAKKLALKAYYLKYSMFRKARRWQLMLGGTPLPTT